MRPPYPVEIVPLLPLLLTRGRAGLDFVQREMDAHGIDRPAVLQASTIGRLGDAGATEADITGPYVTTTGHRTALAAGEAAGLIAKHGERWRQTAKGADLTVRHRRAAHALFSARTTIDETDIARLAGLLERAFQASLASSEPAKDRTHRAMRARVTPPENAFARLEDAALGLWSFRDDCHIAAWRREGLDGPSLDALTRIWRGEATSVKELTTKLPQPRESVDEVLARLRRDGLVEGDDRLRPTARGREVRERVETTTDRLFFSPWPDAVANDATWIHERLAAILARLA